MRQGLVPEDARFRELVRSVRLETGLIAGGILLAFGLGLGGHALSTWSGSAFGPLVPAQAMRMVIPSGLSILLAFQVSFGSFFLSVLDIRSSRWR